MSREQVAKAGWGRYLVGMGETAHHPLLRRFYQASWPEADTPLDDIEFMALDVETTGLDASRHSIVSVGLIPFTLARIRSDQAWHRLVRPPGDLVPKSVTFHHITHSDLQQAPRFADIAGELLERLHGRVAVVHYHPLERAFLDTACRNALGEGLRFPLVDTMQIEAALYPRRKAGWLARLLGKKSISIRLNDSRQRYGLPVYHAHHALTDALATAELLQAQVATHFSAQQEISTLWM